MSIFPIWLNDGSTPRPDKKTFYEVASNGTFLHKRNQFWEAVIPVERMVSIEKTDALKECKPSFETFLPPISAGITISITRLFAWIYFIMNAESMVLLWWDNEKNTYSITVPPQRVHYGGIKYDNPPNPGHTLIGTIHSHGVFPAGHSSIDHEDEKFFDGIHGTFGGFRYGKNDFQISLQASINNSRFSLDPLVFFEGIRASSHCINIDCPNPNSHSLTEPELIPRNYRPRTEWVASISRMPSWSISALRGDKS